MHVLHRFTYIAFLLLFTSTAKAELVFDLNAFYFTDDLKVSTDRSNARTFYNVFFGLTISKKGQFQLGWNYVSISATDDDGTNEVKYTSTQMGPAVVYFFDRSQQWRIGLGYHLVTTGTYDPGTTEEELGGTALAADIGYQIPLGEFLSLGLRLNYNSSTYNTRKIDTTETDVSYSRTMMYPSIGITSIF